MSQQQQQFNTIAIVRTSRPGCTTDQHASIDPCWQDAALRFDPVTRTSERVLAFVQRRAWMHDDAEFEDYAQDMASDWNDSLECDCAYADDPAECILATLAGY